MVRETLRSVDLTDLISSFLLVSLQNLGLLHCTQMAFLGDSEEYIASINDAVMNNRMPYKIVSLTSRGSLGSIAIHGGRKVGDAQPSEGTESIEVRRRLQTHISA